MRTVETIVGWGVGLIVLFLVLSRANEANSIVNTLGGFLSTETRNLQGYNAYGQIESSPSTTRMGTINRFTGGGLFG